MRFGTIRHIAAGLLVLVALLAGAQDTTRVGGVEPIGVIARPSPDSVVLRWAPLKLAHWLTANQYGYTVERFTLIRNGQVLRPAERKLLTAQPLKPLPEEGWQPFVNDKYGMVAAQALYGENFELSIEQGDVMQIVNKARENEQRFSIALFCADMSPRVAKAQGLYLADKQVEKNVRYLYRISVFTPTDTLRGSIFMDPAQKYQLPAVAGMTGETKGNAVTLRWNQLDYAAYYTTYSIERSEDGKTFAEVTDLPGVSLSKKGADSKYQYAMDTLPTIDKEYTYRIRGLSPFGDQGPPSNLIKAKGNKALTANVFITSALSTDNRSIDVQWEFPENQNDVLTGFEVTRSAASSGPYTTIHKNMLTPALRVFKDTSPQQTNYYKLKAKGLDGTEITSMPYLAMLVDSIPPVLPVGLNGKVDDAGRVTVQWKANPDSDVLGYRVYRSYYKSEEFALITGDPVRDTLFTDQVELKSLNEKIHYRIMAIDRNQNHSGLSDVLSLALPDKVPPMPPVWLPVKSTRDGVVLRWAPSGSLDVTTYEVYRKGDQGQWIHIAAVAASQDTVYTYTDKALRNNVTQYYTLVAVDEARLESPPTPALSGFMLPRPAPAVEMTTPGVDREKKTITLRWSYASPEAVAYRIYRKKNAETPLLHRTVKDKQFTDVALTPGTRYEYQVVAVLANGALSALGKMQEIDF